ncbi:ORF919 [White spot syndrome virus]|uniref:ORF919 n=1 Tax=White spot syndrome virus TaxID=342409 RepID=A0A2D3I5Z4_9VIRU|nr:ORF919 [White spot syndrome virus]
MSSLDFGIRKYPKSRSPSLKNTFLSIIFFMAASIAFSCVEKVTLISTSASFSFSSLLEKTTPLYVSSSMIFRRDEMSLNIE